MGEIDIDNPGPIRSITVVCNSDGCENYGIEIELKVQGNPIVGCGACGNPITDVTRP